MPINVLLLFTLPGDDTGVVKHTCGNESSYLMCPQLQPPKVYLMCPNHMKEAQKDYKILSHEDLSQIWQTGNNIARHLRDVCEGKSEPLDKSVRPTKVVKCPCLMCSSHFLGNFRVLSNLLFVYTLH